MCSRSTHPIPRGALAALIVSASLACNSGKVTAPPAPLEGSFTVNASAAWAYASLRDSSLVSPVPFAHESLAWDLALFTTNVTLNGGEAGPGGVTGFCVCQNAGATSAEPMIHTQELNHVGGPAGLRA